eukprot:GEMP01055260.1.p1 GENE.GEMP01055260.1~~GEMP01055260.1.p1  ORF type:complete len:424 (+),score=94.32 GEMP01055260.1:105-1376(+)
MPAMKLFIDWGEERRYVLMVDQTLLVGDLRERVANHFHALFPGEAPLVFFRMRDAEGYFLTDTSMLQDVVEDRTTVECFRGDDELEGRGPKPTCSISSLLKYCAPFALRDAMDGNVEAMNNIVSLIFLDDCSLVLEKMLENINDIKFVQLFIQQGGLFALLRRISSTASTQTASLQLSKKIWHALIRGPFGDQMEELLREVLAKEESGKGSKDEKLCEHNDNNAGILERMAQCPDETVAASGFFDAFFASPEGFERLWPIFLSSARSADLLAAHWSVASPPNGGNWDAVVVPSDVEAILRQALILQPQWIMRCLEDNCFTSAALQALKGMVDKKFDVSPFATGVEGSSVIASHHGGSGPSLHQRRIQRVSAAGNQFLRLPVCKPVRARRFYPRGRRRSGQRNTWRDRARSGEMFGSSQCRYED